jgi:hypothetical protein
MLHSQVIQGWDSLVPSQVSHRSEERLPTGATQSIGQIVNVAPHRLIVLSRACNVAYALLLDDACPAARWVA